MNLNLSKDTSLKFPGQLLSKNLTWENIEELLVSDPNKDIEDEKLNQILDLVTQDTFPNSHPKAIFYVDILLSFLHLKIKKRLQLIINVIEQDYKGIESIKQVEKLEFAILNYLKSMYNLVKSSQKLLEKGSINYQINDINTFESLLYYSDNQEIVFYAIKIIILFLQTLNKDFSDKNTIFGNTQDPTQNQSYEFFRKVLKNYYNYHIIELRKDFPFLTEIFRSEKFFKETGIRPLFMEMPQDSIYLELSENVNTTINIPNIKKELTDNYLGIIATKQIFEKRGLQVPHLSCDFFKVLQQVRIKKTFTALKQRTNICLNILACYKLHFENFSLDQLDSEHELNYAKDLRYFLALKDFPFLDYYLDMQELLKLFSGPKFNKGLVTALASDDALDLSPEQKFIDDVKQKITPQEVEVEGEMQNQITCQRHHMQTILGTLGWILNYLRELSNPTYQPGKPENGQQDLEKLTESIAQIVKDVLDFINKTEAQIQGGIILGVNEFLLQNLESGIQNYSDKDPAYLSILKETLTNFINSFLTDNEPKSYYNVIDWNVWTRAFKQLEIQFSEDQQNQALQHVEENNLIIPSLFSYYVNNLDLSSDYTLQQIYNIAYVINQGIEQGSYQNISDCPNNDQQTPLKLKKFLIQAQIKLEENKSDAEKYDQLSQSLAKILPLKYDLSFPSILQYNYTEQNDEKYQIKHISTKYQDGYFQYQEELKEILEQGLALEKQLQEHASISNNFNKQILSTLYSINAYKSSYFIKAIVQNMILFQEQGNMFFTQQQFHQILNNITEFVHPCIQKSQYIKQTVKNNLASQGFLVSYEHGQGPEITGLLEYFSSFVDKNQEKLQKLHKLNLKLPSLQDSFKRNGARIYSEILSEQQQLQEEDFSIIKTFRILETIYQLIKYYINVRQKEFKEGQYPEWCREEIFQKITQTFATSLPNLNPEIAQQKALDFQEKEQNQNYLLDSIQKQQQQLNQNRLIISRAVLKEYDDSQFPKDSLKYLLKTQRRYLQLLQHERSRYLVEDLLQKSGRSFLNTLQNQNLDIKNPLQKITNSFTNFIVIEQQLRKTLLFRSQISTFDLLEYFKKLSTFIRKLHASFQLNNLFDLTQNEKCAQKQYLIKLFQLFINDWFAPFYNLDNNIPLLNIILQKSTEKLWPQINSYLTDFLHETFTLQYLLFQTTLEKEGPISHKMAEKFNQTIQTLQSHVQNLPQIKQKIDNKQGDSDKLLKHSQTAQECEQALQNFTQFISLFHQKIWAEIIKSGTVLQEQNIQFLVVSFQQSLQAQQSLKQNERKAAICVFGKEISLVLLEILEKIKEDSSDFQYENIPLVQNFANLVQQQYSDFKLPQEIQQIVDLIKREVSHYPPLNTPAIVNTLFILLIQLNAQIVEENNNNSMYFSNYKDILQLMDLFITHYKRAPTSVTNFLSNSRLLFRPLLTQLEQFKLLILKEQNTQLLSQEEEEEIEYQTVLQTLTEKLVNLCEFLEHSGYNIDLVQVIKQTLNLIITCLIKLQDQQVQQQTMEFLRRTVMTKLIGMLYKKSQTNNKNLQLLSKDLHTQMFRLIELLFCFQKKNFIKSNIEIRIKQKLFDSNNREFLEFFTIEQLEKILEPDMFEHGAILSNVLANMIEGFDEKDLEQIRENVNELKKKRKIELKKEGEEEGDEEDQNQEEEQQQEQQEDEQPQFEDDDDSEEAKAWRKKKKEEELEKKRKLEEEQQKKMMEEEGKVYRKLLRLKSIDYVSISTSTVTKLTQNQQKIIQRILQNLSRRVIHIFNSADHQNILDRQQQLTQDLKAHEEKLLQKYQQQQNQEEEQQEEQEDTFDKEKVKKKLQQLEQEEKDFSILYYLDLDFLIQLLLTFMRKYPLSIPYILETKLQSVNIQFLKRHQELPFLDFILLLQPFTNYRLQDFIQFLTENHYTYIEDKKTYNFTSSGYYYANYLFERNLIWLKRCIQLHDFFKHETGLTMLQGMLKTIKYLIDQKEIISQPKIEKIIAFLCTLISKATDQFDQNILEQLQIYTLFNTSYKIYLEFKLQKHLKDDKFTLNDQNLQTLRYHLNINFFDFFSPKDAEEQEGAQEHNELIQQRNKFNYQEIFENQSTSTLTNLAEILRNQHASQYGLPNRNKAIISQEFGLTVSAFKTGMDKLDVCKSILPEFENSIEALFWRKQVLNSQLLLKYTTTTTQNNNQNQVKELDEFFTSKAGLVQLKQELKPQFYQWLSQYFETVQLTQQQQCSQNNKAFTHQESLLFKDFQTLFQNSQANKDQQQQQPEKLSEILKNVFFPPEKERRDSAMDIFNKDKNEEKDLGPSKEENELKEIQQSILQQQKYLQTKNLSQLFQNIDLQQSEQKEQQQQDFDECYLESEDLIFLQENHFPPNALQLYQIPQKEFQALNYEEKLLKLQQNRQKYLEKLSTQKTLLQVQREQTILAQFLQNNTGQFIPPQLKQNIQQTLETQLLQTFHHLNENQQKAVLVSWDDNYLNLLPQNLQELSQQYKSQFFTPSSNKNCQQQQGKQQNFLDIQHLKNNQQQKYQELEKLEPYIQEIPMFDEDFLLKIIERTHLLSLNSSCQQKLEKSLQPVLETLKLLCLNPFNAYQIIDLLHFLMLLHCYKPSLGGLPQEQKLLKLFNLPIFNMDSQKVYAIQRDIKLIKTNVLFYLYSELLRSNINIKQSTIFQYPMWNKPEYQFTVDGVERTYKPIFTPLEIFQDTKLSTNFKGIVDHKKEGDNINLIQLFHLYNKFIFSERAPDNLPITNLIADFKNPTFQKLNQTFLQFFHRVEFSGVQKIFNKSEYPLLQSIQKELSQDLLFEYINYDILENGQRLKDSCVYENLKQIAKQFKPYNDFSKKFLENFIKKLQPNLQIARESFLQFKLHLQQKQEITNLSQTEDQQNFVQYLQLLKQFQQYFDTQLGSFRRNLKDLIQIFEQITLKVQKEQITQEIIQQKREQIKAERERQEQEEKERKERERQEMKEREELEKQQRLAEQAANNPQAEDEEQQDGEEENKDKDQEEDADKEADGDEDAENKEGDENYNKLLQEQTPEPEIIVELTKEDLESVQEQLYQRKCEFLIELQSSWINKELETFYYGLIDYIYSTVSYCWNNQKFGQPFVYQQYNFPLKSYFILHRFLFEEEINKQPPKEKTIEGTIKELSVQDLGAPQQFLLLEQGLSSIESLEQLKEKQFPYEELKFQDLSEILTSKFNGLVAQFIQSGQILNKKIWLNYLTSQAKDPNLIVQMKFTHLSALSKPRSCHYNQILIACDRSNVYKSSVGQILSYSGKQLAQSDIQIHFQGEDESAIDSQQGLLQEWLTLMLKEISDPQFGLFEYNENNHNVSLSEKAFLVPDYQTHLIVAARIIAKALIENLQIQINFSKPFLKQFLQIPLNLSDLEEQDSELYQNLQKLLASNINEKTPEQPQQQQPIYFCYQRQVYDIVETIELIPGGELQEVTEENKLQYVKLYAQQKLYKNTIEPLKFFLQGFYSVVPPSALKFLNEVELGQRIAGAPTIDIDQLKANAKYNEYGPESDQICWLWEILDELTDQQKSQFIFLVTSCFKQPAIDVKESGIEIKKAENIDNLPVAHVCTRTLEIGEYSSKEILQEKLLIAIQQGTQGISLH